MAQEGVAVNRELLAAMAASLYRQDLAKERGVAVAIEVAIDTAKAIVLTLHEQAKGR